MLKQYANKYNVYAIEKKKQNKTYQINDFYFNKRTNISTQHVQDEFIVF